MKEIEMTWNWDEGNRDDIELGEGNRDDMELGSQNQG